MPDSTIVERLLTLGETGITKAVELIETAAPKTWEIAMRQVYAVVIYDITISIICTAILLIWWKYFIPMWKEGMDGCCEEGWITLMVITGFASIVNFIFLMVNVAYMIRVLINSEYYAIKLLSELI